MAPPPRLNQRIISSVAPTSTQRLLCWLILPFFVGLITVSSFNSTQTETSKDTISVGSRPGAVSLVDTNKMNVNTDGTIEIKYSYVGDGSNGSSPNREPDQQTKIARYAAFERSSDTSAWEPLTIEQWANHLSLDNDLAKQHRSEFIKLLANATPHMKAYSFETKGASSSTASQQQFEFVLVDDPYLFMFAEGNPDRYTFRKHLQCAPLNAPGCAFPNLGHDALLVAPRPMGGMGGSTVSDGTYSHLAAFVRNAPSSQVNEFWMLVASEYSKVLKERQVWLSTAGSGVAWLHVRLGKQPKYYKYDEFRLEI